MAGTEAGHDDEKAGHDDEQAGHDDEKAAHDDEKARHDVWARDSRSTDSAYQAGGTSCERYCRDANFARNFMTPPDRTGEIGRSVFIPLVGGESRFLAIVSTEG